MKMYELAESIGMTSHQLREFAPDDFPLSVGDRDEVPADVEAMVREAHKAGELLAKMYE